VAPESNTRKSAEGSPTVADSIPLEAWPVEGILSHVAGPTDDGWRVIDVWESEEAYHPFGGFIRPILEQVRFPGEPRLFSVDNFVK
jgi:hypothetical protein